MGGGTARQGKSAMVPEPLGSQGCPRASGGGRIIWKEAEEVGKYCG